jgi:hypothetical protein
MLKSKDKHGPSVVDRNGLHTKKGQARRGRFGGSLTMGNAELGTRR